jgi:flagellar biosynthesis/type III secretory pathway ATPase
MRDVSPSEHVAAAQRVKSLLAAYRDAEDLIQVGAYVKGANPETDLAVRAFPAIQRFLRQAIEERATLAETRKGLADLARGFDHD